LLYLHIIDYKEDLSSKTSTNNEKQANSIAGRILIPDTLLNKIDVDYLNSLAVSDIDNFLTKYSKKWGVSNEALLIRLLQNSYIDNDLYSDYKQLKSSVINIPDKSKPAPRMYRHREPINIFGLKYVQKVIEAYSNDYITLHKTSLYLDNIKVNTVNKLVNYVIQL